MIRASKITHTSMALILTLAVTAGCDKAADDQQRANAAQAEADKKIADLNREAVTNTTSAQLEADKKIAAASSDFAKRREDYRHKIQTDLVELDNKIDRLEAKSKAATGKVKSDLDMSLTQIRTRRAAFTADMAGIETATAVQWDATKDRMDKVWTDLKSLVEKAY